MSSTRSNKGALDDLHGFGWGTIASGNARGRTEAWVELTRDLKRSPVSVGWHHEDGRQWPPSAARKRHDNRRGLGGLTWLRLC